MWSPVPPTARQACPVPSPPRDLPGANQSLQPLLEYLRSVEVVRPAGPPAPETVIGVLLSRCAGYLAARRGLAERIIARNVMLVGPFPTGQLRDGRLELERLIECR